MTSTRETTRTRVGRRIGADPTSPALLLAGPAAMELWPGVRRVGEVGGRALVEAEVRVPGAARPAGAQRVATAASVRALPPRRTPTAFVSRFTWSGAGLPATDGTLTLTYVPGPDGKPSTHAVLVLDSTGLADSRLDAAAMAAMAEGFLANLSRAAESRRAA